MNAHPGPPILVAQDAEVIDGRLRHEIVEVNGLPWPKIAVGSLTKDERADLLLVVDPERWPSTPASRKLPQVSVEPTRTAP